MRARKLRVASQLQRVLNDLLHNDVKDPRLQGVGVSAVEVSGDIRVARVYVNTLDPDADPEPVMASLERGKRLPAFASGGTVALAAYAGIEILPRRGSQTGCRIDSADRCRRS